MKSKHLLLMLLLAMIAPWAAQAQEELTVHDGSATNSYVPIYGYYVDAYLKCEMVYPATELSDMGGGTITSMTFYASSPATGSWGTANFQVFLTEVANATINAYVGPGTVVYEGALDGTQSEMTITFTTPYVYNGGNLLVGVYNTTKGTYKSIDWAGENVDGASISGYSSSSLDAIAANQRNFLPKTTFEYTPAGGVTCPKPTNFAVSNVTAHAATLTWEGTADDGFNVEYQKTTDQEWTRIGTSANTWTLDNLDAATAYNVRVQAVCDADNELYSGWVNASFTTGCDAVTTFPWSENFESYASGDFSGPCWVNEHISGSGSQIFKVYTNTNGTNSTHQLQLPDMSAGTMTKLMLPEMTLPGDNYQFVIDVYRNASGTSYPSEGIRVYASTDGEIEGATELAFISRNYTVSDNNHIPAETTTGWYTYELPIGISGTCYIILRGESQYGSSTYMDNFIVEEMPSCPKPTGLAVSNILHNEATLSWTENGTATSWQLCLNGDEDNLTTITTNPYTLTNLTPTTPYTAKVRSVGTGEYSAWSDEVSFSTTAVAEAVGDAWSDDFEGATCSWELINGTITNAWAWGTATNNGGTHALYISNDNGTSNAYTVTSSAMVYATKLLNFAEGKYEFTYDWNANGESNYDYLRVALVPASVTLTAGTSTPTGFGTSILPTDWIALDGGNKLNLVTDWQSKSVALNVATGNYYLVLAWRNDGSGGTQPPAAVDNVSITKIACDQDVTDLAVSNITTTGATLSWDGGEATQWQVAYGTSSNFEGATEEIVSTASYNMTGLTASSIYYVRVRAYCGGEDFGAWCTAITLATECDVIAALGYTENFDSYALTSEYTPTARVLPICWNAINTSNYPTYAVYPTIYYYSYTNYANSTPNSLRFYSYYYSYTDYDPQPQYAILPEMNGLAGMQVTLWARGYNASSTFKIGTMSDPEDASTFVAITEQVLTSSYQEFEYIIPADAQGNYLAIMIDAADESRTSNGVYIDDIVISEAPTCLKPTYLTVTGVSTTTATLNWTAGGDETAWQICLNDDEDNLIRAQSNPFTVEGLTASTAYTAKVRAYCGEEDQSEWSNEVNFATECEAIVVDAANPFTEGFEGTAFPPICWENIASGSYQWSRTTSSSYIHTGNGAAYSGYYGDIYLVMPDIQISSEAAGAQLSFWSYNTFTSDYDKNSVVLLDGENEIELWTPESVSQSWVETTIDLSAYVGRTISLAFKYEGNNAHGWYVDDVQVKVTQTVTKEIAGYGDSDGSYYLIASPIDGGEEGVNPETINGMLTDEYDLYYFDEAGDEEGNEWMNYKVAPFNLKSGKGYLYASKNPTTLVFTGNPIEGTEYNVTLNKTEGADWSGWNLVGNPFNVTAYIDRSFYTLDEDGKEVIIANDNTIQPMEGVFVNANSDEEQMTFTTNAPLQGKKQIVLNLTHDRGNTIDRTIVRFGQSQMMPKFMLNENHTKMYIPKDNKEFAMVSGSNNGRLPVNFEPAEDGTYFINVDVENVRVKYLHLIDREMGMDVDLLQNPTYKFEAKTNEKPNRFELVFKTGSSQFKEVLSNISGDNFSFCNNGNWIINNDGDAILQVIDVNGQILSSERISGSVSKHIDATPGVYMLRLVNGENVKVQKIVIE